MLLLVVLVQLKLLLLDGGSGSSPWTDQTWGASLDSDSTNKAKIFATKNDDENNLFLKLTK